MTGFWRALLLAGLWPGIVQPSPITGQEAVQIVQDAMRAAAVPVTRMSMPLRALPPCDHRPTVTPVKNSWARVELRCESPVAWRRILQTDAPAAQTTARAADQPESQAPTALVARRPLVRGQRLTADDLEMKPAPARLGAIGDLDLAVGRRLRAAVQPGQPVLERHLDPAYDLNEGEEITLYLSQGAIEITLTARALENGWIGDRISVQPSNSERLVQAQVIAPGQARIRPNMLPPSAVMDPR